MTSRPCMLPPPGDDHDTNADLSPDSRASWTPDEVDNAVEEMAVYYSSAPPSGPGFGDALEDVDEGWLEPC